MKASKGIIGLFLALSVLISGVCVGDDGTDILDFLPAIIKKKIGNAVAKPFFLVPGVSTPVTITTYIPDANLDPASVQLKQMSSAGTVVIGNFVDSGNKVFSITNNFQGDNGGVIKLSISATLGTINKTIATLDVRVLNISTIDNPTQYNQAIDNIFSTLVATRDNFTALKDPSTASGQFSVNLRTATDRLLSVYSALEAIYRAETHSPSNYPRAAASYLGLGDYLQSAQDIIDDREAFKNDPYYATNPRYAGMREFADELGLNINNRDDRELAAHLYLTQGPDSKFVKQFIPVAQTTITKKMGEQFTDLAGGAIGDLFGGIKGTFIGKGINAGVHKIIDIFITNGNQKGLAVAEVQDGEALQMPVGSHDVLFSFGGVLDRAIYRNIPVSSDSPITINIAPGMINDYLKKWTLSLDSVVESSPAIGPDGTIYVASWNNLYAVNPDGTQKWASIGGQSLSSPAIGVDGTIYVASGHSICAFNPDGTKKWVSPIAGWEIESSPAIGADGTIFVGCDCSLYAINPDGTQKWVFPTGNFVYSSPAIGVDGTIYVGSLDGKLYAINPDGTQKWVFAADSYIYSSSPAIGGDGTIYITSTGSGTLYAINPNGSQKWTFTTGNGFFSVAIAPSGTIYAGGSGNLYALNSDGQQQWAFYSGGNFNSPAIGADGTIFVASNDIYGLSHNFCALNPNGTLKWFFQTEKQIYSSPAIGDDGTIYFGADDGSLYAIYGNSGGLANSPWPMFHHDLKHTGRK